MARAASELSPTTRTTRPTRVLRNIQAIAIASAAPIRNRALTLSAACTCGRSDHQPRPMAGRSGATGWMYGLPKKKARPMPSSISAMPMAMSFTRGNEQRKPWTRPNTAPAIDAAPTPAQAEPVSKATA